MRKLLSVLSSTLQEGVRGGLLFVALLATTTLWAYDFQSGDLYYNITSDTTVEVTYQYEWSSNKYAGLTTATIPETVTYNATTYGVTSIGSRAFSSCSSLTSITIPNSVTSIGHEAFGNCSSLNAITIPNSVPSIGSKAFYGCSSLTSITIPNSVTSIGEYTFMWCVSLTSVTIPNSVTSIGDEAFYGCESLTSIIIPNSVTSIGRAAFSDCSSLTSITIPNSVTSIVDLAFSDCSSLTSITIPNSVTSIGSSAFSWCSSLTSITIPNSVTSIGSIAFNGCSSLTSITIPNSVTSIGNSAFSGCSSLTSITVEKGNSIYDSRENCNAVIETATNTLIAGCQNTIIPNSVTSIGSSAFSWCSSLTSITIPNSVTSIGQYAFRDCSSLTSITIPNSVMSIGGNAFAYCFNLKTVICEVIEVPELLGGDVFYNMPLSEATLYVPAQSLDDYKAAEQWKEFGTILPIEGESEEEIELHDTEMTIVFTNSEDNDSEIYRQTLTIKVPIAPTVAGFTFLYWQPVAEPITNEIIIQAIYEANVPSSAPEVYVNPTNPAQKLLRNGQVYILQDGKTYTITGQEL